VTVSFKNALIDNLPRVYSRAPDHDVLGAHYGALGAALDAAASDEAVAMAQMIITTAGAEWLDYWGTYFGVPRQSSESDALYAQRIIDEVFRQRNSIGAIENNVHRYADARLDIYEPWRNMFRLSVSKFSGEDRLPGTFYCYHIIQPVAPGWVDWPSALAVVEADRPAGTLVAQWRHRRPPALIELDPTLDDVYPARAKLIPRGVSRFYRLSVDHVLSDTHPLRQPAALCARWLTTHELDQYGGHPAPFTLSGSLLSGGAPLNNGIFEWRQVGVIDASALIESLTRMGGTNRVSYVTVFAGFTATWSGAWDSDTWRERAAGPPILLLESEHESVPI
jgi:hypothetical protein